MLPLFFCVFIQRCAHHCLSLTNFFASVGTSWTQHFFVSLLFHSYGSPCYFSNPSICLSSTAYETPWYFSYPSICLSSLPQRLALLATSVILLFVSLLFHSLWLSLLLQLSFYLSLFSSTAYVTLRCFSYPSISLSSFPQHRLSLLLQLSFYLSLFSSTAYGSPYYFSYPSICLSSLPHVMALLATSVILLFASLPKIVTSSCLFVHCYSAMCLLTTRALLFTLLLAYRTQC